MESAGKHAKQHAVPETAFRAIETSMRKVESFVENDNYRGYEPFDGLQSWVYPLCMGNHFAKRCLQQLVRQSPINLRPLLGVPKQESTKGRGYMAWGYIINFMRTSDESYWKRAEDCFRWLIKNKAPAYENLSWANHFEFRSRAGTIPAHEPIIIWTSHIGQALLDAYECRREDWLLDAAKSVGRWIKALPREETSRGSCISYVAYGQSSIHNANFLGGAFLARLAKHTGQPELLRIAKSAMEYSCSRIRPDGSWWYGEAEKYHWVDNFHTAYNLDSLKCYIESTDDHDYDAELRTAFAYWKDTFFEKSGRPKYYSTRTYPVDSQCISQAIDTLANFSEHDSESLALGVRVAQWAIENMQNADEGNFYYRQYPLMTAKTPMLHWAQATMYKSLSSLMRAINKPQPALRKRAMLKEAMA